MQVRQGRYVDVLPYQVALGFTLRWFERRPHVRLYLGPFKLHVPGVPNTGQRVRQPKSGRFVRPLPRGRRGGGSFKGVRKER